MFFGSKKPNPVPEKKAAEPAPAPAVAAAPPKGASGASQAPELPVEEARRRAGLAKAAAAAFGEFVTLLMHAPSEKNRPLSDLEWMILPAIVTGQYVLADAQSKQTGAVLPVAGVIWALVSPEIDALLTNQADTAPKLRPQDWKSGNIPWIIMALGDQKVLGGLMQNLAKTVFKDKAAKVRARGKDGKIVIGRLEPGATSIKT